MIKNKSIIYLVLLVSLMAIAFAQQPTLLSLQGKLTNSSTGLKIPSADLRVNINDSSGIIVFNENFSNAVTNGIFDLVLGSTYYLNLSFNEKYNLTVFVNNITQIGGPFPFRGGQGQIGAGDIATTESFTFANVSVTGNVSIGSNMSVDSGTFFVDATSNRVGIGNTLPNNTLDVSGDINISGTVWSLGTNITAGGSGGTGGSSPWNSSGATVFLNESSALVGIGTTSPSERLVVIGNISVPGTLFIDNESGRVGIGNTLPNNTLDVSGDANISGKLYAESVNITGIVQAAAFIGDGSSLSGIDNTSLNYVYNGSEWMGMRSGPTGILQLDVVSQSADKALGSFTIANDLIVDTNTLYVNSSNNRVGIGARSPNVTFHVSGSANITGTLSVGSFEMSNAGAGTMNVSGQTVLATSSGNVGIGTKTPGKKLEVAGMINATGLNITGTDENATFMGDVQIIGTLYGGSPLKVSGGINVTSVVSGQDAFFVTDASNEKVLRITDTGELNITSSAGNTSFDSGTLFVDAENNFVGIGTSSPAEKLVVIGSVNISDSLNVSGTVQATTFVGDGSLLSGIDTSFTNNTDINVTGFVANNTLFVSGSMVGIGTKSPGRELEVAGTINATGLNITGTSENATFMGDVRVFGTLYGGSPLKIAGGVNVTGGDVLLATESGNVGIGTVSPSSKLEVNGKATISTINLTGGQISFPPTAVPSSDPNTLDDYEEGTWTPLYEPTTGTFTAITMDVEAYYTKVGNLVAFSAKVRTDSINTAGGSGILQISGFPFSASDLTAIVGGVVSGWGGDSPSGGYLNGNLFDLTYKTAANGVDISIDVTDMTGGASANANSVRISGTIRI